MAETTTGERRIKRAMVSLYYKEESLEFCRFLAEQGVELVASGGTATFLTENGIPVIRVADITRFQDILGGRVKTLHPAIFGGILARRGNERDLEELRTLGIVAFDLILVNLYPFDQAIIQRQPLEAAVELIDIGGSSLIRAAAKNHHDVTVIVDSNDLASVRREMEENNICTLAATRLKLAVKAFHHSARYDADITGYLETFCVEQQSEVIVQETSTPFPDRIELVLTGKTTLKYGENPHQRAAHYRVVGQNSGFAGFENVSARDLSFNNLFDLAAAYDLAWEFDTPAAAIIKHATPCGVAAQDSLSEAYQRALDCDPVSAYGSIIALNRPIDAVTAEILHESQFIEAIVAPDFEEGVLQRLMKKKKRRFITCPAPPSENRHELLYRWIGGSFLVQEDDCITHLDSRLQVVSSRKPTAKEMADLLFAWIAVKHVRSNAILIARERASVGIGGGQTSRVDSSRIALEKAGERTRGAVLASDAFFPFRDSIDLLRGTEISAIIEPGGSIRDDEVIQACDELDIALVFTGIRHFRHQ